MFKPGEKVVIYRNNIEVTHLSNKDWKGKEGIVSEVISQYKPLNVKVWIPSYKCSVYVPHTYLKRVK